MSGAPADAAAAAAVAAALAAICATDAGDAEEVERAFASDTEWTGFAARATCGESLPSCVVDFPYADRRTVRNPGGLNLHGDGRLLERMYCFHDPASVETRVYNYVQLAIQKLEAKKNQIADKDEATKYQVSLRAGRPRCLDVMRTARASADARSIRVLRARNATGANAHSVSCLQELVRWLGGFRNDLISDAVGAAWWAPCLRDRMRARWPGHSPQLL